jgi:hypothetical protein
MRTTSLRPSHRVPSGGVAVLPLQAWRIGSRVCAAECRPAAEPREDGTVRVVLAASPIALVGLRKRRRPRAHQAGSGRTTGARDGRRYLPLVYERRDPRATSGADVPDPASVQSRETSSGPKRARGVHRGARERAAHEDVERDREPICETGDRLERAARDRGVAKTPRRGRTSGRPRSRRPARR